MEFFAVLLTGLIAIVSPSGLVVDRIAESTIRQQLAAVEQLQVRVDNAPSHQILGGRVDRVRIAGRGLFPIKEFRIDTLELDTDAIALDFKTRTVKKPLQAGVRVILTQTDLNRALRSPTVTSRLRNLGIRLLRRQANEIDRFDLLNPQITLLPQDRVRFQVELQEQGYADKLTIVAETMPQIIQGRSLQLTDLKITANGQPVPDPIVRAIATNVSNRFDLRQLEPSGTIARILNFKIDTAQIQIAAFAQLQPK